MAAAARARDRGSSKWSGPETTAAEHVRELASDQATELAPRRAPAPLVNPRELAHPAQPSSSSRTHETSSRAEARCPATSQVEPSLKKAAAAVAEGAKAPDWQASAKLSLRSAGVCGVPINAVISSQLLSLRFLQKSRKSSSIFELKTTTTKSCTIFPEVPKGLMEGVRRCPFIEVLSLFVCGFCFFALKMEKENRVSFKGLVVEELSLLATEEGRRKGSAWRWRLQE